MRLRYTGQARADLVAIVQYGLRNDLPDPTGYVRGLRQRFKRLAVIQHPGRKGRVAGTREWVFTGTPYVVAYARDADTITVLRVLHGARCWPTEI